MAVFEKIRIEADKESYPVLLSNGNFIESGDVDEAERHFAVWSGKRIIWANYIVLLSEEFVILLLFIYTI